jgi:membrane-associated phospholipid phosphatase
MKCDVLENCLTSIPNDYMLRLLWFTTMFTFLNSMYAQTADTSFVVRKIPATSIVVPALMITYGAVSLNNSAMIKWDNRVKTGLHDRLHICYTRLDNYLQFVPATAAFGMKAAGVKSVHKIQDMAIMYLLSNLLETGVVYTMKTMSSRMRPDGTSNNSFPSGHTATAFVAAEFLHQEYGYKSAWISVGGYTVAILTGAGRIFNNKHWFSDVVAGAGIGILSVKAIYWTYPSLQKIFPPKKQKSFVYPSYKNSAFCLNFAYQF